MPPPDPLLRLCDLRRHFGGVRAVDGVSLDVEEGQVHGLIGPNGAGKTTLVNLVTGFTAPEGGHVLLAGRDLTRRPPHLMAGAGVARTFQSVRLHRRLTALENVVVGMHARRRHDTIGRLAGLPGARRSQQAREAEATGLLERVGLDPGVFAHRPAGTLAYGDQRRLEMARALALHPRLLVLDEPGAGMNPPEKERLRQLLDDLNRDGLTVLLIDHDMPLVMSVCHRLSVLDFGRLIAAGAPDEVSRDPAVVAAYLGTATDETTAVTAAALTEPAEEDAAPAGAGRCSAGWT